MKTIYFVQHGIARPAEVDQKRPLSDDWILLGEQLCGVFDAYFKAIEK